MTATVEEIRNIIEEADTMAELESLKNNVPLTDQDIDSLDMANVLLLIEEKYGITIPDTDTGLLGTVDDIVAYINSK